MCFVENENYITIELNSKDVSKEFLEQIGLVNKDNTLTELGHKLYKVVKKGN